MSIQNVNFNNQGSSNGKAEREMLKHRENALIKEINTDGNDDVFSVDEQKTYVRNLVQSSSIYNLLNSEDNKQAANALIDEELNGITEQKARIEIATKLKESADFLVKLIYSVFQIDIDRAREQQNRENYLHGQVHLGNE